jgi:hypothetical protein
MARFGVLEEEEVDEEGEFNKRHSPCVRFSFLFCFLLASFTSRRENFNFVIFYNSLAPVNPILEYYLMKL